LRQLVAADTEGRPRGFLGELRVIVLKLNPARNYVVRGK